MGRVTDDEDAILGHVHFLNALLGMIGLCSALKVIHIARLSQFATTSALFLFDSLELMQSTTK